VHLVFSFDLLSNFVAGSGRIQNETLSVAADSANGGVLNEATSALEPVVGDS